MSVDLLKCKQRRPRSFIHLLVLGLLSVLCVSGLEALQECLCPNLIDSYCLIRCMAHEYNLYQVGYLYNCK